MPSSAEPNFDCLALAQQIIDLDAEVNREIAARRYERAAALHDQREALQHELSHCGNPIVVQNVQRLLQFGGGRTPALSLLEQEESVIDVGLSNLIENSPFPPRWVLSGHSGSIRATLERRLNVDALDSAYFQAQLPVLSSTTFSKATKPMGWLAAAIREAARETSPVIWIVKEPAYLAERGLLDVVLQVLRLPSTQFVVCLSAAETPSMATLFDEIPGVAALGA